VQGDINPVVAAASEVPDTNTNGGSGATRAQKARGTTPSEAEANRTRNRLATEMIICALYCNNVNTVYFYYVKPNKKFE
jgi:hypothetical protein